jgi:hypothetical protein
MAIHLDVIAELQRRSVEKAAAELDKSFSNQVVPITVEAKAAQIKAVQERIKREFSDIKAEIKLDVDKTAASRLGEIERGTQRVGSAADQAANNVNKLLGSILGLRGPTAVMAGGAAVLADGALQLAEQVTAATQALWLLPAAAVAAGAGIGTLALATSGFANTIKDIRDPKKFATDIQSLSPAAQQAALSIRNLLPAFDGLKNATQDAFFANMGEQINRLATTYLPSIQNLTTSIATSFNTMLTGVANQLMTPETQTSMQTTFANIAQTFQNLAPAIQPVVKAFTDIAAVGSGFLPGLATDIANAAQSFATFIANARETGQLQIWIQQGIDAIKNLASALGELVQIWYRTFGPEAKTGIDSNIAGVSALKETLQSYNADLTKTSDIIGLVMGDGDTWSRKWNEEMTSMQGPLGALRDGILDIPEAMAFVTNKAIDMANGVKHALDTMAQNAAHFVDSILPGDQSKNFTPLPDIPHVGSGGDWGGYQDTRGPFGNPGQPTLGGGANAQRDRRGAPPAGAGVPGATPYGGPFAVPPPPPGPPGSKPSDRQRRDAIIAGLDPSLYKVDPFAPVPGMPSPGQLAGGPMPGGGYGAASAQDFFEGQQNVIQQAHQLEESRKERLALERDNTATGEQIKDAKWKEYQDEVALQKAQAELVKKTQGTAKDMKSGMDQLGVALDPDLGLSKGLAGFADNLVRFLGNVAMAPTMQKLQAVQDASPIKGGYGLFGIQGAQNISQGLSPILGNPLTPDQQAAYAGGTGTGTGAGTTGGLGGYMGDAALLSHVPAGKYAWGGGDLAKGLTDCSGAVSDLVNILDTGATTPGHDMSTSDEASWLTQHGFVQGMGGPGDFRVGFNAEHTQATLPGGTPFNWGSDAAAARGGVGGTGADDPAFTQHFYRPVGAGGGGLGGSYGGGGSLGGGSIPIPLPVTIVGGGAGGGATPSAIGPAPLGGGRGGTPSGGGMNWDALAAKESSGNWAINTGNGYYGGLQFDQPTWDAYKPPDAPARADLATKEQQIAAGQAAYDARGGGSTLWPQNYQQLQTPTGGPAGTNPALYDPATGTFAPPNLGGGSGGGPGAPIPGITAPTLGSALGNNPAPGGLGSPGLGSALGNNPAPGALGGIEPPSNPGGGGLGITPGGSIDTAMNLAASAFPGVGQAAATGMKLANRAIQYAGQVAGIGVQGLMETFLPTGGSELANNSWLTRIVGGLAGASPQIPNIAGGKGAQNKQGQPNLDPSKTPPGVAPPPLTPQQVKQPVGVGQGLGQAPITVNYQNHGATEDRAGADIAHNLTQVNQNLALAGHR